MSLNTVYFLLLILCVVALIVFYCVLRRITQRTEALRNKEQQQAEILRQLQAVADNSQLTDKQLETQKQDLAHHLKQLK
ncbi:hypothetical protein [Pseudomonas sp. M30-35]|uniref:hypothetical protein n=1 Tax=Pseudomonas sp. M30-35 TaxID=1981174 RepID=UPI000B3CAA36|nr:hypothetical protein [Pseudomonas sp. M30-35]ARU88373.1 hypothetical protein B9K09_10535 [Pseudomonas sp. M30-35]